MFSEPQVICVKVVPHPGALSVAGAHWVACIPGEHCAVSFGSQTTLCTPSH